MKKATCTSRLAPLAGILASALLGLLLACGGGDPTARPDFDRGTPTPRATAEREVQDATPTRPSAATEEPEPEATRQGPLSRIGSGPTSEREATDAPGDSRRTIDLLQPDETSPETDREALVAFYNAVGGSDWSEGIQWLTEAPLGEWHGVVTDLDGRVVGLRLSSGHLWGSIPPELGNLTSLEVLDLADNRIMGEIPPELGNLTSLEILDLAGNEISGEIPPELSNLTRLQSLRLDRNSLTGEIPRELGNLASLERLDLGRNHGVTGEIPSELGNLASLESLDLEENLLEGEIPRELGNLTGLESLHLGDNENLSGEIPAELGNLTGLESLDLSDNSLTGEIPPELGNLPVGANVDLGRNQLEGKIPVGMEHVFLSIRGNDIDIPQAHEDDLEALAALHASAGAEVNTNPYDLDWSYWLSEEPLHEWKGVFVGSDGRVTGLRLYETWRSRQGFAPELWDLSSLRLIDFIFLIGASASGGAASIPHIPAGIDNLTNLRQLSISMVGGEIPPELGNISGLEVLRLRHKLTGEIPPELGKLSQLRSLELRGSNLGGVIPPELGSLSNLEHLAIGFGLTGEIPPELGDLVRLEHLELQRNQLSGEIPVELGDLARLEHLELGGNQLTGEIPTELGNLTGLVRLDIHGNKLTGGIPPELGNLIDMRILTLFLNSLSGEIPRELGALSKLTFLGLIYGDPAEANQFSGCIPTELRYLDERNRRSLPDIPFC